MPEPKTNGFFFLPIYYEAIRDLEDKERLEIYDAIFDYGFGVDPGEMSPCVKGILEYLMTVSETGKTHESSEQGGKPTFSGKTEMPDGQSDLINEDNDRH